MYCCFNLNEKHTWDCLPLPDTWNSGLEDWMWPSPCLLVSQNLWSCNNELERKMLEESVYTHMSLCVCAYMRPCACVCVLERGGGFTCVYFSTFTVKDLNCSPSLNALLCEFISWRCSCCCTLTMFLISWAYLVTHETAIVVWNSDNAYFSADLFAALKTISVAERRLLNRV